MPELSTLTLARLYAAQGSFQRALIIYDSLLDESPEDGRIRQERDDLAQRISEADGGEPPVSGLDADIRLLESWLGHLGKKPGD